MICLTRLNNRPLVVNSELIKFIENAPDTVITLISGEKIVVLETAEEVMDRIINYRRILHEPRLIASPDESAGEQPEVPVGPENPEAPGDPAEDKEVRGPELG